MPDITYILGAGSLGLLFAAKLSRTRVTLLIKPEQEAKFNLGVNYRTSPNSISKKVFLKTYSQPKPSLKIHRLIIATKAGDAAEALSYWLDYLAEDAQVLMLQNGMGSQAEVAQLLQPTQTLMVASLSLAAYLKEPNLVIQAGQGTSQLGLWQGSAKHALSQWHSRLTTAGIDIEITKNIRLALWHKLAVNSVINPLTALNKIKNGELATKQFKPQVKDLIDELDELFNRLGLAQPAGGLAHRIDEVILATAQNFSSMHQDITFNKPTEINYITASLLKAAKAANLPLPKHEELYQQIKSLEANG